jgi:hypothetical protein
MNVDVGQRGELLRKFRLMFVVVGELEIVTIKNKLQ